jgi:hypothetical protein
MLIFTKASSRRLGSGKCLPKCKRTSGSLGKPILKEALIYTSRISKYNSQKFQELPDTILLVDKGKTSFSTVGHDLMHDHPYAKAICPSAR